jgi:hypothetical protein
MCWIGFCVGSELAFLICQESAESAHTVRLLSCQLGFGRGTPSSFILNNSISTLSVHKKIKNKK